MENIFFLVVILSLLTSFVCSLIEAALIALPLAHARHMAEEGTRSGKILLRLKEEMTDPITAVLILSTIASTLGPAVGGAGAGALFGERGIVIFAFLMAGAVLVIGELIPKFLGVAYCKQVAVLFAIPIDLTIKIFWPVIVCSRWLTSKMEPEQEAPVVSQEEVLSMAALGTEEGALDHLEGSVISNVIGLDEIMVRDILTPRMNVFRIDESLTLSEVASEVQHWNYSRIPVHASDDPDLLIGYVRQRDILRHLLKGEGSIKFSDILRPIETVPELMRADKLLLHLLEDRQQICSVVDERGSLAGVVTLEDVLEEVVGREIVDEYDIVR